ncbi:hypothetical protein [Shimia aestuarii]|uniref:hypothetical protein n=1 Tax=Shimia aestuarii TaxID=254406 RepID=UPI0013F4DC89|nr:hypothetical protein [Shimia aestuarii]
MTDQKSNKNNDLHEYHGIPTGRTTAYRSLEQLGTNGFFVGNYAGAAESLR